MKYTDEEIKEFFSRFNTTKELRSTLEGKRLYQTALYRGLIPLLTREFDKRKRFRDKDYTLERPPLHTIKNKIRALKHLLENQEKKINHTENLLLNLKTMYDLNKEELKKYEMFLETNKDFKIKGILKRMKVLGITKEDLLGFNEKG